MQNFILIPFLILTCTLAFASEEAFQTEDQERLADDYIHQGLADRTYFENCSSNGDTDGDGYRDADLCNNSDSAFISKDMQMVEALVPVVAQAYSMIGMAGGGLKKKDSGKDQKDFCKFIPFVGEQVNTALNMFANSQTQQNYNNTQPQYRQKAAFEALKQTHKDKEKASWMQTGVWGSTAGCYVAYGSTGSAWDATLIAKIAASTVIGTFYGFKADAHKKRAEAIGELMKKFPENGKCNPIDQTMCFCSEISSYETDPASYKKYCLPAEMSGRYQNGPDAMICADMNGKVDPSCECEKTNTCLDRKLKTAALDLGFPPTVMKDPLASLKPLSKGFGTGNLNGSNERNRAIARKIMDKYKPKKPIKLSAEQKKLARAAQKLGLPAAVAAEFAANSVRNPPVPPALANIGGSSFQRQLSKSMRKKPKEGYKRGGSVAKKRRSKSNPFGRFKKRGGSRGGIEIDGGSYAEKARLAAEIHGNSEVSIFKVISNRYQRTGWKQFPEAFENKKN